MKKLPVLQTTRAAYAFARLGWKRVIGPMSVVAVGSYLSNAGELSGLEDFRVFDWVGCPAMAMSFGALLRAELAEQRRDDPRFRPGRGGFQWSGIEWRLLCVWLLTSLTVMVTGVILGSLFRLCVTLAGMRSLEVWAFISGVAIAFVVVSARVAAAAAATVDAGKVRFWSVWKATRGQTLRLTAIVILGYLPLLAGLILGLGLFAVLGGYALVPDLALEAGFIGALPIGLLFGYVQTPVGAGVAAVIYRALDLQTLESAEPSPA